MLRQASAHQRPLALAHLPAWALRQALELALSRQLARRLERAQLAVLDLP